MHSNIYKFENFEHIYGVDRFEKEFAKMANEKMKGSPPYSRFQKWLIGRLTILDRMGRDAIRLEGFEKLESENPALFSIRYPHSKLNPRVIYACVSDDDIILLTAFKEENARADYRKAIRLAKSRYKLLDQ